MIHDSPMQASLTCTRAGLPGITQAENPHKVGTKPWLQIKLALLHWQHLVPARYKHVDFKRRGT